MRRVLIVLALAACSGAPSGPAQSGADVDGDGVPDVRDRCAYVAGTAELDGCPVVKDGKDGDRDGILDAEDNCPEEPEDMDGRDDRDGCPEAERAAPTVDAGADVGSAAAPVVDAGAVPVVDAVVDAP